MGLVEACSGWSIPGAAGRRIEREEWRTGEDARNGPRPGSNSQFKAKMGYGDIDHPALGSWVGSEG